MKNIYLICIGLLMLSNLAAAQQRVSEAEAEVMQMQVKELVANYFANLNSIGDKDLEFSDRELVLANALKIFESKDVMIFNDLDPSRKESASLKAEIYLGNIITKFAKGLNVEVTGMRISEVFYDKELQRNFLKAEVSRSMKGIHINQSISRSDTVDVYIAFIKDASSGKIGQPVIYGIESHQDNLSTFIAAQNKGAVNNAARNKSWRNTISSITRKRAPEASADPLVFVKSPTGKKYAAGSRMTIRWKSNNIQQLKGELYKDGRYIRTLFTEAGAQQQYKWRIPAGLPAGDNYALRLSSLSDEAISELSGKFAIRKRNKYRKWIYAGAGATALTTLYLLYNAAATPNEELPGFPDPP